MAFIRYWIIYTVYLCLFLQSSIAQTVAYPVASSELLKSTAKDVAAQLQKSIPGSIFITQAYTSVPATGIVLIYDSSITDNQACRVSGRNNQLVFTAAEDNGLVFGLYQYLAGKGFKFYQPGTIWEKIPALITPYATIDTVYSSSFKYKSWGISGGHNRWIMDNGNNAPWDIYFGDNGYNWALYQRRNGMLGAYRYGGHRDDISTNATYVDQLKNNPCFVANYNGSRIAVQQSVPDVNNQAAMGLWSSSIQQKFQQYSTAVMGNTLANVNLYRNFSYNQKLLSIEVPDGAQWGNTNDQSCGNGMYSSPADQHFTLANFTAARIRTTNPGKKFQVYAYSAHAGVPSPNISIDSFIDVQVVPTAFQNETTPKALVNRWASRKKISEYHYYNIGQWGGETPVSSRSELSNTVQRAIENKTDGIFWEASPAKFASLPFLKAANDAMLNAGTVDGNLRQFCLDMFGAAAPAVNKLLLQWSDDEVITSGAYINDNKYKLPYYYALLSDAVQQVSATDTLLQKRLRELKAYCHYMRLYYEWAYDTRVDDLKKDKAAALCIYLAKINRMQLVNSYIMIGAVTTKYEPTDPFYIAYNKFTGTAYDNGNLPLITDLEIDQAYTNDRNSLLASIPAYNIQGSETILAKLDNANIIPLSKISVALSYGNSTNSSNKTEFFIRATQAGSFTVQYTPKYNMEGKGFINFVVEMPAATLGILKDLTLTNREGAGSFSVNLPAAGVYKLSVITKFQTGLNLDILTGNHIFYKNTAFLGTPTENYRANLESLPGYFFAPAGLNKIYLSLNNSLSGGDFLSQKKISDAFMFKDAFGNRVEPKLANSADSTLYYLDIPEAQQGNFWQVFKMENYRLCFANINNLLVYGKRKDCAAADFKLSFKKLGGNCITHLTAVGKPVKWELYDNGRQMNFGAEKEIDLPDYISPNAMISLFTADNCSVTKRLGDMDNYLALKQDCGGAAAPTTSPMKETAVVFYPNPGPGIYKIGSSSSMAVATDLQIMNAQGTLMSKTSNVSGVDISRFAAGIFTYKMTLDGKVYTGKLVKL
ncbi:MAG: hypothetical protein JWQ27_2617 [Ferruginibacter sp.]|nr:hypothetical protein [Ferruginibacter sp.]